MSFCYNLLITVLITTGTGLHTNAAPVGRTTVGTSDSNYYNQGALEKMLMDATFNSDNFYTIRKAFQPQPGTHKICIPVTFNVTCADQLECEVDDNCTSGFCESVLWTEFNVTDTAGKVLFYFAVNNLNIFGFDWAGACDANLDLDIEHTAIIDLNLTSLSCTNTSIQSEIRQLLLYLATLVRNSALI